LVQRKEKAALPALMKIVHSDQFIDTPGEEKRRMLEALAIIGEEEIIPLLTKLVHKRRWLKRDKHNENRILAIGALGLIQTPKASETLKELAKKRNKAIRQACQRALHKMSFRLIREKEPAETA
jgi:HEAT repeat protein